MKVSFILSVLLLLVALPTHAQFEYSTNADNTITITGYEGPGGVVMIPSTINDLPVTDIAEFAFFSLGLTSVTIPGSVVTIEDQAFYECFDLAEVTISNGVANIGQFAFGLCDLTNVFIPASVTNIQGPFVGCPNLIAINVDPQNSFYYGVDGVLFDKVQQMLVEYPGGLAGAYTVPSNITSIASDAFGEGTISAINISASVTNIGDFAFEFCSSLTNAMLAQGVTSIGSYVFYACTNLGKITIPSTVTNIGEFAFAYSGLTNIIVAPGPTNIGQQAFSDCVNLLSITIPESVSDLGQNSFSGCSKLTNCLLPKGMTVIGGEAFYLCSSLNGISIPNGVGCIGDYAFDSTGLESIMIPGSVTNMGQYAFASSALRDVTLASGATSIGAWAFYDCLDLTNVTIPGSIASFGIDAFNYCTNLKAVTIPIGIATIPSGAFNFCFSLEEVTIPTTVTSIQGGAFSFCSTLTDVFFQGNAPSADSSVFNADDLATAYYLSGTTGWDYFSTNTGLQSILWNPMIQTSDDNFGVRNNQFGFDITGTTNIPIVVEACTNLANPVWISLQSLTLTNGLFYFSEPFQSNTANRFYRISSP